MILPLWFYLAVSALAALLVLVVGILAAQRRAGRSAADPDKETPPAGWNRRRTFKPICKPSEHDWYLPGDGRAAYCLACGEPMDYQPHSDRHRITGTEVKAADPRRTTTLWEA